MSEIKKKRLWASTPAIVAKGLSPMQADVMEAMIENPEGRVQKTDWGGPALAVATVARRLVLKGRKRRKPAPTLHYLREVGLVTFIDTDDLQRPTWVRLSERGYAVAQHLRSSSCQPSTS